MKRKITNRRVQKRQVPKKCEFCELGRDPWFSNVTDLQKFTTERGKITGRARNGLCARHQRLLSTSIKHARYLALMPFVVRV